MGLEPRRLQRHRERLKAAGLWSFYLLMLIILNCDYGPDKDGLARWHQLREVMLIMFERQTHKTSALFQAYVSDLWGELGDRVEVPAGQTADEAVWNYMREKEANPTQGSKIRKCKWMGIHRGIRDLLVDLDKHAGTQRRT